MNPTTVYWVKQALYQTLLAACVLFVGDGVLRDQSLFVVRSLALHAPSMPVNLWVGFLASTPFGTLAAASLLIGGLSSIVLRRKQALAEAWLLQLVATAAVLGAFWARVITYLPLPPG